MEVWFRPRHTMCGLNFFRDVKRTVVALSHRYYMYTPLVHAAPVVASVVLTLTRA
jgi:hypothetical protein